MVIYFYEEGRGAGLEKKIEAIRLQQTARMTTTEAYECLRLEPDVRNYEAVGFIVRQLLGSDRSVSLLTNDPRKERLIREAGVNVSERRPLVYNLDNPAIKRYLREKAILLGHEIDFGPEP
jgi:GTP cyclohydrolase II